MYSDFYPLPKPREPLITLSGNAIDVSVVPVLCHRTAKEKIDRFSNIFLEKYMYVIQEIYFSTIRVLGSWVLQKG